MKNLSFLLLLFIFPMISCGDKPSEEQKEANVVLDAEPANGIEAPSEKIKDCEDFMDTYETWSDDILELMEKHKKDPVTLATSPEYVNTMMKGVGFMRDWETISFSCATDPSYEARMKAIQEKMEAKQKELGFK
ncbi:MAG: hypothetical protein AAFP76_08375 [Bacteroidota bacterium]